MLNAHSILGGSALIAAAIFLSNAAGPVVAQSSGPVIPPVEALVPAGENSGANGPWHIWRINRHTGQLSFCTAERSNLQGGQASQTTAFEVDCTKTSSQM